MKKKGITHPLDRDSIEKTETSFSRYNDSYTETGLPIPTYSTRKASSEGNPDSNDKLRGSRKTLEP